jgi:heme/copper-type cytochrome/quinol oxidase subunit 3
VVSSSNNCSVFDTYHPTREEKEKMMDWRLFATVFGVGFIVIEVFTFYHGWQMSADD